MEENAAPVVIHIRVSAELHDLLVSVAAELPGMTHSALVRSMLDEARPELEWMLDSMRRAKAGDKQAAVEMFQRMSTMGQARADAVKFQAAAAKDVIEEASKAEDAKKKSA